MMSTNLETKATLSSKFSVETISIISQLDIYRSEQRGSIPFTNAQVQGRHKTTIDKWLTFVANLLSLRRFGEAVSFFCSFIQEASTNSDGWMALK